MCVRPPPLTADVSVVRFDPYIKPSVLFVGHRQIVKTQIRRRILWRLIKICTFCLHVVILNFE